MIKVLPVLLAIALASPAAAAIVKLDFKGTFIGTFSAPLVPIGTAYSGTFTFDSASPAVIVNSFDKRYAFANAGTVIIGDTRYVGSITAIASKGPFGPESVGFFEDLGGGVLFALRWNALPAGSVIDLALPGNPLVLNGAAFGAVSNARFQGDFGSATVAAALAPSTVPEPATWASMLVGLAIIGGVARHRRPRPMANCTSI